VVVVRRCAHGATVDASDFDVASWIIFRASYISTLNVASANQAPMRYASADPIHRRNGRTFCGDITSDLSQDSSNTRHPEQGRFPSPVKSIR